MGATMKKIILLALSLLSLFGCKETEYIQNGVIPEQYLDLAKNYEGIYDGQFAGSEMSLDFKINSERKLTVQINTKSGGHDLFNFCDSTIGDLETVKINPKTKTVSAITFKLIDSCKFSYELVSPDSSYRRELPLFLDIELAKDNSLKMFVRYSYDTTEKLECDDVSGYSCGSTIKTVREYYEGSISKR